jgi:hypothetical protein
MKNLLIFCLTLLGLTSCTKDSLEPDSDNLVSIDQSEVAVTVTYLTWSDLACDLTCTGGGSQYINYMANAKVDIFPGTDTSNDQPGENRKFGTTNTSGAVLFEDLAPGQYTIIVDTPLGQKSRVIFTQLHRRTSVEFSF